MQTVIAEVAHDNVPVSVNKNAIGTSELAVAAALRADGSNMRAVTVLQHLHAIIGAFGYEDMPRPVKGKGRWVSKLAVA